MELTGTIPITKATAKSMLDFVGKTITQIAHTRIDGAVGTVGKVLVFCSDNTAFEFEEPSAPKD